MVATNLWKVFIVTAEVIINPTTCNQCYKTFTSLYLQVWKYRPISKSFVAMNVVQYNILMLVFTLKNKLL